MLNPLNTITMYVFFIKIAIQPTKISVGSLEKYPIHHKIDK